MSKLILIYTPYHQLFIGHLIHSRKLGSEDIFVLDFCENRSDLPAIYYHFGRKNGSILVLSLLLKLFGYSLMELFKIDTLLIPHSDGIIANILTHKTLNRRNNKIAIDIYHEGVLSFYNYKENPIIFPTRKFFLSLLCFHIFKYKNGFLPIESARTFYIPMNLGKHLAYKVKTQEIRLSSFAFGNNTDGRALFLGQPDYYDRIRFQHLLCKAIADLKIERLYYKPHPVETSILKFSNSSCEIIYLDKKIPIEKLASELDPKFVLSGLSSAVVSLISANPDVSFIAIVPTNTLVHARNTIAKVFKEIGVNLVSH